MRDWCALTNIGNVRPNNEDFHIVDPKLGLYILADGMGGAKGGERASQLAVETVARVCRQAPTLDPTTLLDSVEQANRAVWNESRTQSKLEGMGTTLVAALDLQDSFAIASVGDSRAYVFDGGGLRAVTEDQTWVQDVGRPLGLDEEALSRHPMRHVLTMALGVGENVDIRYYKVAVEPGSKLLISTDGLHGVVASSLIETILGEDGPGACTSDEKCHRLIDAARQAGGPDNITVILIHVG